MTTAAALAGLDGRVVATAGQQAGHPVRIWHLPEYRAWFAIRRAPGPSGVVLTSRIPGCLDETESEHADQDAATAAAHETYAAYVAAVEAFKISDKETP